MNNSLLLGNGDIVANEELCKKLYSGIKSNTAAHAYIIEGKTGSGRHTIVKNIIAAMACSGKGDVLPCKNCKNCKSIFEEKCPDVIVIGKEDKASIGIDAIRKIKESLITVPNNLDFKVYIIEDADSMTLQAQNAFLLTLEEPPKFVKFFIICENSRNLLETIRSRASILRTELIDSQLISEYLCSGKTEKSVSDAAKMLKRNNEEEFNALLLASNGSIGKAIELLSPKLRKPIDDLRALTDKFIDVLMHEEKYGSILSMIQEFSSKRDDLIKQLEYIKTAMRDLIALKKSESAPLCFFTNREKALDLSSSFYEKKLFYYYDLIEKTGESLIKNANVRLSLVNMLSKL